LAETGDQDGFIAAMTDWTTLGRFIGQRLAEFGQKTQSRADYHKTP